ncbi:hypothetical protein SAMN04488128_1021181 [Chitinophaga eiseniae]|uniref:Uncharacterized protein n=2 Tax=Chitinophaga eiseniae TaxID=634771 RepID=A0A1T4RIC8_9BACT|nr:hypothetical protein SAMN04488128_1021181 [Chitinophaga eiseniae]
MIGCLMIGPLSLQAQVPSGKITEAASPVSGNTWLPDADSGHGRLSARGSAQAGNNVSFVLFSRNGAVLFTGSPAAHPLAPASGSRLPGGINARFLSGSHASGRQSFDGFFTDGLPAGRISFGSFLSDRPSKEGRTNDHIPLRIAPPSASSLPPSPAYLMTSHAYYDQHFGFFCKKEWGWQKQTGIPVKLRLGSYDLTQRQEGK